MKKYVDIDTAIQAIQSQPPDAHYPSWYVGLLREIPAADVVSRETFEQFKWERDLAIQQLREDYGVELGEKKHGG